jgi:hypothetical protein
MFQVQKAVIYLMNMRCSLAESPVHLPETAIYLRLFETLSFTRQRLKPRSFLRVRRKAQTVPHDSPWKHCGSPGGRLGAQLRVSAIGCCPQMTFTRVALWPNDTSQLLPKTTRGLKKSHRFLVLLQVCQMLRQHETLDCSGFLERRNYFQW